METTPLKNFAIWARIELIREVSARIAAVLAPGSTERVERGSAVAALEKAITAAGGGAQGQASVADKVAYTWFNRIIALRFMDANGYTGIGVVSPQLGVEAGQPEILAEAKRGVIDVGVVSQTTRTVVAALLDGSRGSGDPQGEAYALLLEAYCRSWHKTMPFMFEREGDFTELLIPANLLADDSVLNRSVRVLTEDVCKDVEVIGWLYQFYISERKDEVFAGFKKNKKAGAGEIPAATQLFTPHWIVRYLVENSLGRLWMLNRRSSRLASQMDYYIAPVDEEPDFLKITKPEELKVIDPACGSGHMLTYAFDLLYAIYEEEGYGPAEIPGLIVAHNLYGTEIDPRAGALAAFALTMKARSRQRTFFNKQIQPNICVIGPISFSPDEVDFLVTKGGDKHAEQAFWNQFSEADILGSLIQPDPDLTVRLARHLEMLDDDGDLLQADALARARQALDQADYLVGRYTVLVANPPYMGAKQMGGLLSQYLSDEYPEGKSDLFAAFMLRGLSLVQSSGFMAQVTMQSWMVLSSYEALRATLRASASTVALMHMGNMVMRIAFGTSAAVWRVGPPSEGPASYLYVEASDLGSDGPFSFPPRNERNVSAGDRLTFLRHDREFHDISGAPVVYWLPASLRSTFAEGRPLREIAEPRKGMDTGDNARFLRAWWEVSRRLSSLDEFRVGAWVPYNKGGGFRRWYGYREFLIDWRDGGKQMRTRSGARYFGREGWTWGTVTSGGLSMRYTPPGAAFDNGGCTLFSDGDLSLPAIVLNSSTADAVLAAISPTLNFQPINIGAVPMIQSEALTSAAPEVVAALISASRADWDSFETSWDFSDPTWAPYTARALGAGARLRVAFEEVSASWESASTQQRDREAAANRIVSDAYGVTSEVDNHVPMERVSLTRNVRFRYGAGKTVDQYAALERVDYVSELVSYAVGCMFGRYSLDEPGLILADQGATLQDYLAKVPTPTFTPDADNVIPIVDGDWFEDDIVERFRQFLRAAFGEQHFEENLRFVTESLGVKNLHDYFVKSFYKDHIQRYKKRPIYWLFSSPKGSFNALIYLHRYTPSTASTVLNEYLREFQAKIKASLEQAERANNAKEAERLRKILLELDEYEHDVLYPLASQSIVIDLDDGVKANYPKFGAALKRIPGLVAIE